MRTGRVIGAVAAAFVAVVIFFLVVFSRTGMPHR
jgi:hypothetical protein